MRLIFVFLLGFILLGALDNSKAYAVDAILTWQDNSGNDLAVNDAEDGFRIERKLNTGNYVVLTTVGPNVVTATDTTLVQVIGASNTYCYRVQAFNVAGNSTYSNEACKVVPPLPLTIPVPASNLVIK